MIINRNKGFVFFCNPKTGSTTIKRILNGDESQPPHIYHITPSLMVADGILNADSMHVYTKCAFVRNPYEKFLSTYLHGMQSNENLKGWSKNLPLFGNFEDFVHAFPTSEFEDAPHFRHQIDYTTWQDKFIDFIGMYERYDQDVSMMFSFLGYEPPKHKPRVHPSHRSKPTMEYYTKEMKQIIRKHYLRDFKAFYPDLD